MAGFPIEFATRIKTLPPYLFAAIDKMKQEAIARGVDIINLASAILICRRLRRSSKAWPKPPRTRNTINIPRTKACCRFAKRWQIGTSAVST